MTNNGTKVWQSIMTSVRYDPAIHRETGWNLLPPNSAKVNVLMYGFDSLSRLSLIRNMPKSYKYLREVLKADILTG